MGLESLTVVIVIAWLAFRHGGVRLAECWAFRSAPRGKVDRSLVHVPRPRPSLPSLLQQDPHPVSHRPPIEIFGIGPSASSSSESACDAPPPITWLDSFPSSTPKTRQPSRSSSSSLPSIPTSSSVSGKKSMALGRAWFARWRSLRDVLGCSEDT